MSIDQDSLDMSLDNIEDDEPIYRHVYMMPTEEDIKWIKAFLGKRDE